MYPNQIFSIEIHRMASGKIERYVKHPYGEIEIIQKNGHRMVILSTFLHVREIELAEQDHISIRYLT